jgi:hypothetical protein
MENPYRDHPKSDTHTKMVRRRTRRRADCRPLELTRENILVVFLCKYNNISILLLIRNIKLLTGEPRPEPPLVPEKAFTLSSGFIFILITPDQKHACMEV